ncbi:MAG: hypothetical protein NVS9B4_02640 [Candidatus Acidiferrum sp.]
MQTLSSMQRFKSGWRAACIAAVSGAALLVAVPWAASQERGPLKVPAASGGPQSGATAGAGSASGAKPTASGTATNAPGTKRGRADASSNVSTQPPSIPVEQIIEKFSQRESEFKKERDNYTYSQTFIIQTIDDDGVPDGEYQMKSDILFTPSGKRYEKVVYAPPPTLQKISMSQQDLDDLEHLQPFVLTAEELPKYDVKYVGREPVDQLNTYVFDVAPKQIEKNQRYFQGRIWVDDGDLEIVKSDGKAVPDIVKKGQENVFPRFETYRENIEGHYWFPVYTRADDVLHFSTGGVHIRMTVKYANYKRFGVSIKIGAAKEVKP